ncbi:MAG: InlB B-repeat-containing protein [Clostridia bacterium]|nr:InlB B-repeat-containing protein [Clostridia bacterium]
MKKLSAILALVLMLCLCVTALAADDLDASKKVSKADVGQLPTKTAYVIGEEFTLEGGTILVTYTDGTTDEIPMTAESITVKEPGLKASGTKTVQMKVGGKNVRFSVSVANNSFSVTYDQNYDGAPAPEQVETVKGEKAENKAYTRDGYTLLGWYVDPDFTAQWDFKTGISEDVTLYALWTRDGAEYAHVTFDYDFYGVKLNSYTYPVETGTPVAKPVADPVRTGYTFDRWVTEDGTDFDFTSPITGDTTVKAAWQKAVSGMQEYIFEAEDTNLTGKTGPAISGTANEVGMIMGQSDVGASGDRYVGYMYQFGNSVDFYLACDEDVDDATISVSLSAEMEELHLTPAQYGVSVNGEYLSYDTIDITDVPAMNMSTFTADPAPFKVFVVGENVKLRKGANVIKLETLNSDAYTGTTMLAHAPLADYLKIETTGVVTFDENYGEPALDNYKK